MIPKHLASLFWDTNVGAFDPRKHPAYTIARVLERGDERAVAWMRQTFSEEAILEVLRTDGRLSSRSANFWALYFHLPASEVTSLRS